jgi:hypothetical protein
VANTLKLPRNGGVGFIDWLDLRSDNAIVLSKAFIELHVVRG